MKQIIFGICIFLSILIFSSCHKDDNSDFPYGPVGGDWPPFAWTIKSVSDGIIIDGDEDPEGLVHPIVSVSNTGSLEMTCTNYFFIGEHPELFEENGYTYEWVNIKMWEEDGLEIFKCTFLDMEPEYKDEIIIDFMIMNRVDWITFIRK